MGQKQSAVEKRLDTASKTRVLALKDMKLKKIPKKAFLVDRLRTLDLSSNLLAALPQDIAGLEALQNLNLSGNRLSVLPAELCGLPKLENVRRCRCALRWRVGWMGWDWDNSESGCLSFGAECLPLSVPKRCNLRPLRERPGECSPGNWNVYTQRTHTPSHSLSLSLSHTHTHTHTRTCTAGAQK